MPRQSGKFSPITRSYVVGPETDPEAEPNAEDSSQGYCPTSIELTLSVVNRACGAKIDFPNEFMPTVYVYVYK